jgi:hypothetical protein
MICASSLVKSPPVFLSLWMLYKLQTQINNMCMVAPSQSIQNWFTKVFCLNRKHWPLDRLLSWVTILTARVIFNIFVIWQSATAINGVWFVERMVIISLDYINYGTIRCSQYVGLLCTNQDNEQHNDKNLQLWRSHCSPNAKYYKG